MPSLSKTLLTFIHISDTHIHQNPDYNNDYADITPHIGARALVKHLNDLAFTPDFVLHTGDVAYNPDPDAYVTCKAILGQINYPVYYVVGNHDESNSLKQYLQPPALQQQPKPYFDFEINGVQIIFVDSNGPAEPPAGYITEEQLTWLNQLCSADDDRPLIIAAHHNPLSVGIPWLDEFMAVVNGDQLHAAILPARERLRGVFFGHVHQNIDILRDGILYSSAASSWVQFDTYPGVSETTPDQGAEPGYSIVTITAKQTFIRRCRFPLPTS
jgi:3',5'-cyclic-AMP phosphodiesterase